MKKSSTMIQIEVLIKSESITAILIEFNSDKKLWILKSTIHSQYIPKTNKGQTFSIENWILRKNNKMY